MRGCRGVVNFVEDKHLEGQKRAVLCGSKIYVSPAIYSLLKDPTTAAATLHSLEFLEVPELALELRGPRIFEP